MSNIKNIPEKIYLQIGDECPDDADFNELSEVSWCKDKIYDNDIEFALQNKASDVSAEKWKVFSHTSALGNTGDYMSDCGIENGTISFYCDKPDDITNKELQKICDNLNASIVNEKDNIPADFKQVTGHNSPKEMIAYEKGREDEQEVIMKWIEQWDGSSNSAMGTLLKKKFDERKDNVGVNDAIEFADWLNKNASRNAVGSWGYFGNMFYTKTSKELYDIFKSESQPQQKEVDGERLIF